MIRILTSLVAVLTIIPIQAQVSAKETPKLVVGITIDQLRGDYLEHFKDAFGERGFKRLFSEGLVYQNIKFDFFTPNRASSLATIYTGANPTYHGIIGTEYYSAKNHKVEHIFADNNFIGNYTADKLSPLSLKGTSITDELKIASRGSSDIYSFAATPEQALITAGRYGNTAFWIDDYSGKWASTTFYKDFFWTVDQDNRKSDSFAIRAWGLQWTPFKEEKNYRAFPYTKTEAAFQHNLGYDKETYKLSKKTPFANENIRTSFINLLDKADVGQRVYPSFVSLTFYAGKYPKADDYGLEIKDTYIRLDKDIEQLLDKIDSKIGLHNVLIFVASTGYFESETATDSQLNGREFHADRCEALLNMYLMAIYGQNEKWVEKYYNGQIFLNKELIKSKNIKLQEIRTVAAEFISEFTGVHAAYTYDQVFLANPTNKIEYLKNGLSAQLTGDIIVEVESDFVIVDEQHKDQYGKKTRTNLVACPVIFMGGNIKPERIKRTINATEIASSIAYIMRIRAPSASKEYPLIELQ